MAGSGNGGSNYAKIALVVTSYFIISISLVFVNKLLLSSDGKTIPAPLFVTWYQCVVTIAVCWVLGLYGSNKPKESFFSQFPAVEFNVPTALKVMPLSIIFVFMIILNNLCLKFVEVSFYNVARSLTIVANVIFTYFLLGSTTSSKTCMCLLVVIAGFFIGSDGEVNFSLKGTLFGVFSSVFVSLNSIFTKKVLPAVNNNEARLTLYNNINAVVMFIPMMLLTGELQVLRDNVEILSTSEFWVMMTVAGLLGFLIGIVTIMQIQVTSPLTHNISGTAKACVQTVLALIIWQNPTTFNALLGIFLVIFGSLLYAYVKITEDQEKQKAQAQTAYAKVGQNEAAELQQVRIDSALDLDDELLDDEDLNAVPLRK